jgi:hypothetical protein
MIMLSIKFGLLIFEWLIDTFSQQNLIVFFALLVTGVFLLKVLKEGKLSLTYSEKKLIINLVSVVIFFYFFFEYVTFLDDFKVFKYLPGGVLAFGAMLLAQNDLEKLKLEKKAQTQKSSFEKTDKSD